MFCLFFKVAGVGFTLDLTSHLCIYCLMIEKPVVSNNFISKSKFVHPVKIIIKIIIINNQHKALSD